jgi:glycosyltransferase involved in cell wall biosynthesis
LPRSARASKAKLWCVLHGIDAWQRPSDPLISLALRDVTRFVAVSNITRERFAAWSRVHADQIELVRNCYDPALFHPGPRQPGLLARYGLGGRRILLTCARLVASERYKGIDEVIEVLGDVAQRVPHVAYLVVGDGDDRARLERKAIDLALADRVRFAGYVEETEKADIYRLADIYVMPSRGEGFGIVFLEAMACGLPTIASKLDGGREALLDGKLGRLIDPANRTELREAIFEAFANPAAFNSAGVRAFSLEHFRRRIYDLFGRDVNSRERSDS